MNTDQRFVVTIARELGSGGRTIGREVAERLGVTQPAVARMESGKNVSIRSLSRYAAAVGKPIQIVINPASAAAGAD